MVAVAALTAPAVASPAEDPATDGVVFAGVTGIDPANAKTNPAALLRLPPGLYLFTIGTVALDQLTIQRRLVAADDGTLSNGPEVSGTTIGAGVAGGVIIFLVPGVAIAATSALRPPAETLADDRVGYQTRGSRLRRIDWFTIAGAVRVTSRIFVGVAVAGAARHQRLGFFRDAALEAGRDPIRGVASDCGGTPCGLEHAAAREAWRVDVGQDNPLDSVVYTVGVMARLPKGMWAGLAAERQLSPLEMTGDVEIVRAPRDGGGLVNGEAVVRQRLPEAWRLGLRGPVAPGWELAGELRWRRLGRTDQIDVRVLGSELIGTDLPEQIVRSQGLRDGFAADLGLEPVDVGQRWRFGGKLGIDRGVVAPDRLSPRAPWGTQVSAALGAQLRLDRWILQLGYRFDAQLPTSSDPSAFDPIARLDCVDAHYDYELPACETLRAGYATSTAAGTYGRFGHTVRVALRFVVR